MKTIRNFILLVCIAFLFISCGNSNSEQVIRIGTESTYSPYTYHDNNGKLVGFDVEVIAKAAQIAGLKPEFFETSWDAMFAGLNSNRFDVIANQVSYKPHRAQIYALSDPYCISSGAVAVSANNTDIKTIGDLKDKKIAQATGSSYYEIAVANGAKIVIVDNLAPALKAVSQGRADGTFNDRLAILNYLQTTKDKNIKIAFTAGEGTKNVFVFRKGNEAMRDKINAAIKQMKEDGTLKQISQKYFGVDVSE